MGPAASATGEPRSTTSERADRLYQLAHQSLEYDPQTGTFRWRVTRGRAGRQIGGQAGGIGSCCRRFIGLHGRIYRADRLAILMTTGCWPCGPVVHRDGDRANDALSNLLVVHGGFVAPHLVEAMPPRAQKFVRATVAQYWRRQP